MPAESTYLEQRSAHHHEAPHHGTIIVASDGLDHSAGALAIGQALAHHLGAGMEVVSVLEPADTMASPLELPAEPVPPLPHRHATRISDRREQLRMLCDRIVSGDTACATRILIGDVPSSIARAATCHGAPIVVTGRMPHGVIERALHRETPIAIARAGRVPVLAVREDVVRLPRCVVVAVRSGEAAARLAPIAGALFHDALVVHLVAVVSADDAPWESDARAEDDERYDAAERAVARSTASWSLPADVPVQSHVLTGDPAATLATFARTAAADLLVVGQLPRARGVHLPIADLATRLYRSVSCATLIVPVDRDGSVASRDATAVSLAPHEWPALLRDFTRRNSGRTASLLIENLGDQPREAVEDWTLIGVDSDPGGGAVGIVLAHPADATRHLSHMVAHPTVVAVQGTQPGCDERLVIAYVGGQLTLLLD